MWNCGIFGNYTHRHRHRHTDKMSQKIEKSFLVQCIQKNE